MAKKSIRSKGGGTLELRGHIWRARWVVDGQTYTRSTGTSNKREALDKLEEFTHPYRAKGDVAKMEGAIAQLEGRKAEIREWEDSQPALTPQDGWAAYVQCQSRPRSGERTIRSYEQEYLDFCEWLELAHPEAKELRNVSPEIGKEYARFLLAGTPKSAADAILAARNIIDCLIDGEIDRTKCADDLKVLESIPWTPRDLSADEPIQIQKARHFSAMKIRLPARGTTFNRHLNTLALVWRVLATEMQSSSKLGENPFGWDKETGKGIRRIVLKHGDRPHRRQDLTLEEIAKILQTGKGEMRLLVALGFYTGLRLADCVTLDWGKIDRVNGLIVTRSIKTDIETKTRVHPALAKIITEETTSTTGYLMPGLAEIYLSGDSGRAEVSKRLVNLFREAGINTTVHTEDGRRGRPDKTFHSLRHAFVTQLERAGATLRERQALAGHSSGAMTAYYTHQDGAGALALPDVTADATKPTAKLPKAVIAAVEKFTREQLLLLQAEVTKRLASF